jgi:putative glutamine amidotransferase
MKQAPLILIAPALARPVAATGAPSLSLSDDYPNAIVAGGGIPWICCRIPSQNLIGEAVRRCDGVLLTGGEDVQTELYTSSLPGQLRAKVGPTDPERDWLEMLLIGEVFRQRKPLMAICRGHQMLNVALGGTLVADIPTQIPAALNHDRKDLRYNLIHDVRLTSGSMLAKVTGTSNLGVNSSHHQAVRRVAEPLRVTGTSPDGIIESMELQDSSRLPYLLSVQFHPERLVNEHDSHLRIFRHFVQSCSRARKRKL